MKNELTHALTQPAPAWQNHQSWVLIGVVLALCAVLTWVIARRPTLSVPRFPLTPPSPVPPAPAPVLELPPIPLPILKDAGSWPFMRWWKALIDDVIHVILVGGTGSGKTYTCKKILDGRIRAGHKIVILDPHARKNRDKWGPFAEYCIGFGRNFTEIESMLVALLKEMSLRYDMEDNPCKITVVLEETPAISTKCPTWSAFISEMAFEARKIDIHLIVVAQSDRVEPLGIKGKGDLRDSLSFLRLGAKATQSCPESAGMVRGGSFQSQELDSGIERAVDLDDLNTLPDIQWSAEDFWLPEALPDTAPILIAGSPVVYGVRSIAELRNGIAAEWPAMGEAPPPDPVAALGAEYVRLHALLSTGAEWTNKQLVEALYPGTDPTAPQCAKIGRMKSKLQRALTPAAPEDWSVSGGADPS